MDNPTDLEVEVMERWDSEDQITGYLLIQWLPDLTAMEASQLNTAKERWGMVQKEYTAKSKYMCNDLEQTFLEMCCLKGGNVRTFLTSLKAKRNELTAVGVAIAEKDYQRTVLRGIPDELARFALQLLTSARLVHSSSTVDINELIQAISEEADRLKIWHAHHQTQGKDDKKGQKDEALATTQSDNAGGRRRRKGKCHNCGKPGHWARECRSPKKVESTSGQSAQASLGAAKPENKPVGSTNVVVTDDIEGDGFWMAIEEVDHAQTDHAEPDPFMGASEQEEEEACAELDGAEDIFTYDEPDDWLDKEGEETTDESEMAGMVITSVEEERSPRTELYDSSATHHISPYKTDFTSYKTLYLPTYLNTASQQRFPAIGEGNLVIRVPNNNGTESALTLHNALHAPTVTYTLVSIGALDEEGYAAHIKSGCLEIISPCRERVGLIPCTLRRLHKVVHASDSADAVELIMAMELHRCLGHISVASAHKLVESRAVQGIELDLDSQESTCDTCIFARAARLPISKPRISMPTKHFGDEVHTDVWGPSSIPTRQGRCYFASFMDDCTWFTVLFLIQTKDEVFNAYKTFEAWVLTQQHCKGVKVLRSDCGSEYLSKAFDAHLAAAGTACHLTPHDMPQLNGIAERLNRTLLERVRALTHTSGLPKSLWGEALRHVVWLKNWMATWALDSKTPYEALYGQLPNLSELRRWGCAIWVHDTDGSKLDVRACEVRWLGFDVDAEAYRVYWLDLGTISVERNIYFGSAAQLEGEQVAGWKAHADQLNEFGAAYHHMQETFMGGYSAYTTELKAVEECLVVARARTRVHATMVQLISQGQLRGRHCWMGLPGLDAHPYPQILPEPPHFIMAKDLESQVYIPVPVPPPSHLPCTTDMPPSPSPSNSSISSFITEYSPAPEDRRSSGKCPKNVCPHCSKSRHFGRECKTPHIYCANCGYCKLRAKSDCKYSRAHGRQARIMRKKIKAQTGSGGDSRYVAGINEQELAIDAGSVLFDMDWSN